MNIYFTSSLSFHFVMSANMEVVVVEEVTSYIAAGHRGAAFRLHFLFHSQQLYFTYEVTDMRSTLKINVSFNSKTLSVVYQIRRTQKQAFKATL